MWLDGDTIEREPVIVEGHPFIMLRPRPSGCAANGEDTHWTELWPAARMLAKAIMRETWPANPPDALEIGCGLGLAGVAALARGLRVTFSDRSADALKYAACNARLNHFTEFETLPLDWCNPPDLQTFGVVLGSDLFYQPDHVPPVAKLIKRLLNPDGLCLLTDEDRVPASLLAEHLTAQHLVFTSQKVRAGEPGGRRSKGTLYRIRHKESS